jgi:hypothetical protein
LGIVLSLLWTLVILVELWIEIKQGPFSLGFLTETVVSGPVHDDGSIPVDQVLSVGKFLSALLIPVALMWVSGLAWAWVRAGFRSPPK